MKTCKEMASVWHVTERTVTTFCKTGKIPGAIKVGKSWQIPDDAEKPVDGRISSGRYVKKSPELKSLHEMRYDAEMKEDGIQHILKFGIAFSGKKVSVKTQ